jgi:ATP-binding cassette, subfamily C, bacterial
MLNRQTINLISYFVRVHRRRSALIVVLLILSGMAEGFGVVSILPLLELSVGDVTDDPSPLMLFMSGVLARIGLQPTMGVLLAAIVAGMFLKGTFMWLSIRQQGYAVAGIATDLRMMLIRAFLRARWSFFVTQRAGHMSNAIGNEAQRASMAFAAACGLLAATIQAMLYTAVAFLISPPVAIAAILAGILLLFLLQNMVTMAREAGQQQTQLIRSLSSRLVDALYGIKPIKAMGREAHLQPLLESETRELNDAQRRQVVANGVLTSFQEPLVVACLAFGLFVVLAWGSVSFGALLVMAFLFHRLVGRIQTLQTYYQQLVTFESAFWSIINGVRDAETQEEQSLGRGHPPALEHGIEFRDVRFAYGDAQVLRGVSFNIRAGEFTALTGSSGAGKTTIADLILGLYMPSGGAVLIDDVPLSGIDLKEWRGMIGYVPQEMLLFHESILRNVTLGDSTIPEADVIEALKAAGAWQFVYPLEAGIHTVVGEHGAKLSGGQRQRIAIARALVGKPRLLLLDEVTTALDPLTEASICETLRELAGDVTILSISHQPAMQRIADAVIRLDAGQVTTAIAGQPALAESAG